MRRFISNLVLSLAILVGVGATCVPTLTNMNCDGAYASGKTMTFRIQNKDSDENDYYDPDSGSIDPAEGDGNVENSPIYNAAKEFRNRLNNWNLSEYSVETLGNDTIQVTLSPNYKDDLEYERLAKYLCFSGGDISLAASNTSYENYPDQGLDSLLDGQTAHIEYIESQQGSSSYPVAVIQIRDTDEFHSDFLNLIKYCNDNTVEENADENVEGKTTNLVVWGNAQDDDYIDGVINSEDENVENRIIAEETTKNNNAVWYASDDDDDDEKEHPYLMLVPTTIQSEDASDPYREACYFVNMLNASEYTNFTVHYLYSNVASATVEDLITYTADGWHLSPAMSKTLIATLVGSVILVIVLALFEKWSALCMTGTTILSVYLTLLLFLAFGMQFNIAALFGLLLTAILCLFGQVYYLFKLKNELYKGRPLKKANQEAAKKALGPTVDASIVSIILGVFVYIFTGNLASKLGVILVAGGLISGLLNTILFRLQMWLFATDNYVSENVVKFYGLIEKNIPDMLKEEKQTYFGPYSDKDFSKGKKWSAIVTGLLVAASVVTMAVFGSLNGVVYNTNTTENTTVLLVESKAGPFTTADSASNTSTIQDLDDIYGDSDSILKSVFYNGKSLYSYYSDDDAVFDSILSSDEPKKVFASMNGDAENATVYYWYFWEIELTEYIDLNNKNGSDTYYILEKDGTKSSDLDTLNAALNQLISDNYSDSVIEGETGLMISAKNVVKEITTPSLAKISLSVGIAIAVSAIYLCFRYRSRGLSASLLALTASFVSVGFFAFTRISTGVIVSIAAVGACLISYLLSLYLLGGAKEIASETHDKERSEASIRFEALEKANSYEAGNLILIAMLSSYIAIDYFAFGPASYGNIFIAFLIGTLLSLTMNLSLLAPYSDAVAKLFGKIHIKAPKRKKKKHGTLEVKRKSGEPTEATFIGIND